MTGIPAGSAFSSQTIASRGIPVRYLVCHLEVRKKWYIPRPLDRREEEARGQLADIVNAHDVAGLDALAVPAGRVRLCSQKEGNVTAEVRVIAQGSRHRVCGIEELIGNSGKRRLRRGHSSSLYG